SPAQGAPPEAIDAATPDEGRGHHHTPLSLESYRAASAPRIHSGQESRRALDSGECRMAAATLLAQYEAGEFEAVWRSIRLHAKLDDGLRDEVHAVANATMRRVAQNADLLADRLRSR